MEKGGALHLIKLESPSPKDALCQVWLKLAQWFRRRRLLKFVNVFLLFGNYLPLEKDGTLHLNKLKSPSPKDENVKSLRQRQRQRGQRRQRRTTDKTTENLLEPSAQVS